MAPDEVAFEADVFLLRKATAEALRAGQPVTPAPTPEPEPGPTTAPTPEPGPVPGPGPSHRFDADAASLGHRPSRSLESSRHEDPSEAPLGLGAEDWTGVLGHSLG